MVVGVSVGMRVVGGVGKQGGAAPPNRGKVVICVGIVGMMRPRVEVM